ncbi:hypothetical protein SU69_05935 [Thermosipho melanesiensis]|uniref:Uncharacterized protein n=1 Tax=Thermosipho melanesiensis TaxID=46541 RepID=A0ABM6GGQ8_9BACT|nr:hypothetical protein [Thermosipho melanesiensis]APT74891.1 hypothetical protein BW47_06230 [Thermosipho melanesiensis]OOC36063.1 hypothetical protein SU68_06005 [Thermosipho melanesiensis]OOC36880.1 hypothetical protein SU69_05935 [Thermosipho melanesiensis]OOC37631.1 hypothetical protein SU70_05945 [Thermosipho melanesiensis]OOC40860.1 hypothetical protein SU71_05925 [Thermosipho melanesiensis]
MDLAREDVRLVCNLCSILYQITEEEKSLFGNALSIYPSDYKISSEKVKLYEKLCKQEIADKPLPW